MVKANDCKSFGIFCRWFESNSPHSLTLIYYFLSSQMYKIAFLNFIIILIISFLIFLFRLDYKNFFSYFFNKNLSIFLIFFLKKKIIYIKNSLGSFIIPLNTNIFWKPIFKKTSYIGYYFNNFNKWK